MTGKGIFHVFFTVLIASFLFTPLSTAHAAGPTGEVVVGNISAMTGPTSGTHMMCQSGSRDYLNYLNETKGGISGKDGQVKVKYLAYDSQYVAAKAKDGFARLREQGMEILTHCASGHSDALMMDYEQAKIPLGLGVRQLPFRHRQHDPDLDRMAERRMGEGGQAGRDPGPRHDHHR